MFIFTKKLSMAILCRCGATINGKIHLPDRGYKNVLGQRRYTLPLGYPINTSSICGINGCKNPGRIYLSNTEVIAADNIIGYPGREQTQVKVDGIIVIV